MTARPTALVIMLDTTRPPRYSLKDRGVENRLTKLRAQTSSKNAVLTPYMTRLQKSQSSTAPSRTGTKSKVAPATPFRYRAMYPHNTMSMATQMKSGTTRVRLPRSR